MDAIMVVDESHCIRLFNRGAEEIFGCPAADALGQPINCFLPTMFQGQQDDVGAFGAWDVFQRDMPPREIRALRATGDEFPAEARISQGSAGDEKLYTVILRDITDRRRGEDA